MEQWITETMSTFGYFGIFLLIALENIFPPIPSEVILTFGGYMTTSTDLTVTGVILSATAGSLIGAICLYGIGRLISLERLEAFVSRRGKLLRLKPEDVCKAYAWFDKYGIWAVLLGRLIPLIRSLISIPAGSAAMKLIPFLLFTTLGSLIWNSVLVSLGAKVGASWETILGVFDMYSNVVYALLVVVAAGGYLVFKRMRVNRI